MNNEKMKKPIKPIEPKYESFPAPIESNAKNFEGKPLFVKHDYIKAMTKYYADFKQYEKDCEDFEQIKFIKYVKNNRFELILKKYKIIKI